MVFGLDHNLCEKHERKPVPKDEFNVHIVQMQRIRAGKANETERKK